MSIQLKTALNGTEVRQGIAPDDGTFTWDYQEQSWYHKTCDQFHKDDSAYCLCGARNPRLFNWQDFEAYARECAPDAESLYFFEYADNDGNELKVIDWKDRDNQRRRLLRLPVWNRDTMQVIVYWHPGSCEGYYVSVDILKRDRMKIRATVSRVGIGSMKVWSAEEAATIADKLTRFAYLNQ